MSLIRRILELSFRNSLTHIGSCLTCVGLLQHIYETRDKRDPVILSNGHAGLCLYCVLEKYEGHDAQELLNLCGVHPVKYGQYGIWCSTGSLGQGITVAVGRALAHPDRNVWCVISDGEASEGCVYEALLFAMRRKLSNLKVFVNCNGYSAYGEVRDIPLHVFPNLHVWQTSLDSLHIPFIGGQNAHYYVMSDADWTWVEENIR